MNLFLFLFFTVSLIFQGKLPLSGISVNRLEDIDTVKNSFEITGKLGFPIIGLRAWARIQDLEKNIYEKKFTYLILVVEFAEACYLYTVVCAAKSHRTLSLPHFGS